VFKNLDALRCLLNLYIKTNLSSRCSEEKNHKPNTTPSPWP
jgi:hypothetical protein